MGETDSNGVIRIMKQMNKGTRKMLALIEAAKGDLEVVKEDDLMGMIENINDDTYFEKIKPTTQKTVESSITVSQKKKTICRENIRGGVNNEKAVGYWLKRTNNASF